MEKEVPFLKEEAKELFEKNHRVGVQNGLEYDYSCPSPVFYPHQWLWDSCFHAIVLTHLNPERAKKEITTLLSKQKENGMVPLVSIWNGSGPLDVVMGVYFSSKWLTQSPVIPISVDRIYQKDKDENFVKEVYPKLKNYFDWINNERDKNGNSLPEIILPWESGLDSLPVYDKTLHIKNPKLSTIKNLWTFSNILLRYSLMGWNQEKIYKSKIFIIEDLVFNSIYAKSLNSMIGLAGIAGEKGDALVFSERYKKTKDALINLCWSDEDKMFYSLDAKGKQIRVSSIASFMPLILPDLPQDIVKPLVEKHLLNEKEYWTTYPLTTVPVNGKSFNPGNGYVLSRGPTWIETNWFLSKALANYGYKNEADHLIQKSVEMVEKSGFWEFYNPFTGEGYGQKNLGWSTLVLDMVI